ncbi:hypothetical protein HGRIS_005871 [Hohenbuehelia grisea]|uniref:Alcohol dehydrogenase n=1 Tax=Hohenbuehelia grisea TaxID=104357 RepID=A0ABR3JZL2_9AGAR
MSSDSLPKMQKAVRWHPPSYDVRVEEIPVPKLEHPDDAIVKVKYTAICGSDLHVYRGHGGPTQVHTIGHEFIGEVISLGESFGKSVEGRPPLYATLTVGNKVVAPFTANCGECHVCRLGYTGRCPSGVLFGCDALDGGQAQYVRVPKAGGTLFNLDDPNSWISALSSDERISVLKTLADTSLLLLADILPTGVFAATQAVNHPKVLPMVTGVPWPYSFAPEAVDTSSHNLLQPSDKVLTFAVVGLGPVGVCATISLLDILATRQLPFNVVAIDPTESRRSKMQAIYDGIDKSGKGTGQFSVSSIEGAKDIVDTWTAGIGCSAILEVVGNNSALTLAYDLVRPFGAIVSVGVHGEPQVPFEGRQLYNKNVSLDFGRCPARAMFPPAFDLLVKRQDVFGHVGEETSLIHKVVGFDEAVQAYDDFDKGRCGKVIFDPWK